MARGEKPSGLPRRLKGGTVRIREYNGERHTVTVLPDGFAWQGQTFSSLAELSGQRNAAVFFPPDVTVQTNRVEVAALVGRLRLPAICSDSAFVKAGALLYYGADRAELFRRAAGYVDRILRGERAGDLPFQQPTKYELMTNLKTTRALGLQVSATLLALADEVIE